MSGSRQSDLPNPDELTRQPGSPSSGGGEAPTPEEALEEARAYTARIERERDTERQRASEATRQRDEAETRARTAGDAAVSSQERELLAGIQAQKTIIDQAEQEIVVTQSAGDAVATAKAFRRMSAASALLDRFEGQKAWIDQQKTARPQEVERQQQPTRDPSIVSVTTPGGTMDATPSAKSWMDKHPRFYDDSAYYNHAVAAHSTVVADGIREGTPAYFRALDDAMARYERFESYERGDGGQQQMPNGQQQAQRRGPSASSMGAPVSRSSVPVTNRNGVPSPEAIARHIGPAVTVDDLREFARHNGYKGEEGFQAYLKEQQAIIDIQRAGGDAGLRVDGVYR